MVRRSLTVRQGPPVKYRRINGTNLKLQLESVTSYLGDVPGLNGTRGPWEWTQVNYAWTNWMVPEPITSQGGRFPSPNQRKARETLGQSQRGAGNSRPITERRDLTNHVARCRGSREQAKSHSLFEDYCIQTRSLTLQGIISILVWNILK